MLAVEAAIPLAPDTCQILHRLDQAICFFFLELMRKGLGEIRRLLASRARAREVEGMDVRLDERQIALTEDGTSAETA